MKKLTTIITTIILLTSITIAQNYSLSFDGEDDYVYRDDAVFDADGDWTISGWITTISDSSPQYIFSTSWSGNHNQNTMGIIIVDSGIKIWRRDSGSDASPTNSYGTISTNICHHIPSVPS